MPKTELFDTHCHFQSAGKQVGERHTREIWAKNPDLTPESIRERAIQAGVTKMICVGCDLADSALAIDTVQSMDNCWASIGIHPHEADEAASRESILSDLELLANRPKVVAVGECGLDYFYEHSDREAQKIVFEFQIKLARKHGLPMIFHVRDAFDDFWQIFNRLSPDRAVLHSFTDNDENMKKAVEQGLYIGVNGIATFAKNPDQIDVYRSIPLQNLVLETDAPYLTPTPYRGSINEPKRVGTIVDFLAELRGEDREHIAAVTTRNACKLFGL